MTQHGYDSEPGAARGTLYYQSVDWQWKVPLGGDRLKVARLEEFITSQADQPAVGSGSAEKSLAQPTATSTLQTDIDEENRVEETFRIDFAHNFHFLRSHNEMRRQIIVLSVQNLN